MEWIEDIEKDPHHFREKILGEMNRTPLHHSYSHEISLREMHAKHELWN